MRRSILSLVIVMSALVLGANAQVIVTPEGWATTPGPAIGVYGLYAPVLVTPVAHLETPRPAMGATAAAPGQQVGATSSPVRVLTPTPPSIIPKVVNAPPMVYSAVPPPEPAVPAPPTFPGAQTAPQQAQPAAVELGIAPVQEAGSTMGGRSLAEAAAAGRQGTQRPVMRSITNQDVQRLNQQTNSGTLGLPAQPQANPAR